MIEEKIPAALILEDDVALPDYLPDLLNFLPVDGNMPEVLLLSRVNKFYKKPLKSLQGKFNIHKTQSATTTHSYIVNLPAAKRLLAHLYPIWMTADKWSLFEDYSLLRVNAIIPAPVELSPDASISTINEKKGDSDINTRKRLVWDTIMKNRPLKVKIKHRIRRGLIPIFYSIIDQGKGPS